MSEPELTPSQISNYRQAFAMLDKDGDGSICITELATIMRSMGHNPTDADLDVMFKAVDADGNGKIDFNEFLALLKNRPSLGDQELRDVFKLFDKDDDGFISSEELKELMRKLGKSLTDNEVEAMIREADIDGDGQINYEEFLIIMTRK